MRRQALELPTLLLALPIFGACAIGAPEIPPEMVDAAERRQLLRVTKSENANYVVYDQILDDSGQLADAPLDVYWIMEAEAGQREELNTFEQDIYGITIEQVDRDQGWLVFAINAVKAKRFEAGVVPVDGSGGVFTTIGGGRAQVTDVHLEIRNTWNPLRPEVEVHLAGMAECETGAIPVEEVITP